MKISMFENFKLFFSIWWSIAWRASVYSVPPLVTFYFIAVQIFHLLADQMPKALGLLNIVLVWLIIVVAHILAIKGALAKKHNGFSVQFVKD